MADIAGGLSDIGSAVSDLFGAVGSSKAGSAYGQAAQIATENEQLTLRSGQIEEQQLGQQTYQTLGAERATTAGAGLTTGGSATDLMAASGTQAAISKQLLANQTQVTAQGFAQQAAAYKGQQQSAQAQASGGGLGGLLSGVAGIAALF